MATTYTFSADDSYLINRAPGEASADGLVLSFTITGTNSGVLAVNTAPPGAAVSLSNIAYLNGSLVSQSAGTAITATGLAYVSAENATRGDLYLVLNWTSGSVVVNVAPSSLGGGGSSGGTIPAGDVTSGTFGANTGDTGTYGFPNDVTVADDLTAADIASTATMASGTTLAAGTSLSFTTLASSTTALATPSALAATALNAFASTVSGATLMGFGTTHDVTLKNRAGTSVLGVTANTSDVTAAGALAVTGALTTNSASDNLAQAATTATVAIGAGTNSGTSAVVIRGAAGQVRQLELRTGAASTGARWKVRANTTAEGGANAGSDLTIVACADSTGADIDDAVKIYRVAAGAIVTASGRPIAQGGDPGAALTKTSVLGSAAAIADNVATTIATITVPNAAVTTTIRLTAQGALGAGGAIGAREAMASNSWNIVLARTAGVNVVAQISAAYGADAANVAGAATCTAVVSLGAVAGAVGATNTVPVQITIVKSGGASDNHTASWEAVVLNAAATGATIA